MNTVQKPRLSVVVVVYDMPRQAMNTLFSLALPYQKNVSAEDYEVIVVENRSSRCLDPAAVAALGSQFHYFLRDEPGVSPVPAVNFGLAQCRGEQIGLLIDGARLVTPRVLEYAMLAARMNDNALVMVPGYHLGERDQKFHLQTGHSESLEVSQLQELAWQDNGYRLFKWACWSSSNQRGYLQPMQECNALFCSAENFRRIGGADVRFDQPGGGSINLYLYRKLGMLPEVLLYVLPGEGSFHQFHSGVTTQELPEDDERRAVLKAFDARLEAVWGGPFKALTREPILLGAVTHWAQPFLEKASEMASQRFARLTANKKTFWDDDAGFSRFTENAISCLNDGYERPAIMQRQDLLDR
ncbi:MAG: glycosyltransferase family 2 protein [Pseudomonadales bacterium]|nr:glycosyltransferase family 2 protein [Pseudomonadales bacterium]